LPPAEEEVANEVEQEKEQKAEHETEEEAAPVMTPPRLRAKRGAPKGSDLIMPEGFVEVPAAEGSKHKIGMRVNNCVNNWMSCDIHIPPKSSNDTDTPGPGKSVLLQVLNAPEDALVIELDGKRVPIASGDQALVKEGRSYRLRNISGKSSVQLKMILFSAR
jgi:hypothetical protein